MKKVLLSLILIAFFQNACKSPSPEVRDLKEALNKVLVIDSLELAHQGNRVISIDEIRQHYDYFSVVFLKIGCKPCYPKYIEWHRQLDSISLTNHYTVLFVIQGNKYEEFMSEVFNYEYVDSRYYTVMDPEGKFLESNKDIPRWIIDASVLIDAENKIKMVGAPWLNEDMTQLFYACANSQAGDAEGAEAARLSHLAPSTTEVRVVQVVRGGTISNLHAKVFNQSSACASLAKFWMSTPCTWLFMNSKRKRPKRHWLRLSFVASSAIPQNSKGTYFNYI